MNAAIDSAAHAFDDGRWSKLDPMDRGHVLRAIGTSLRPGEFADRIAHRSPHSRNARPVVATSRMVLPLWRQRAASWRQSLSRRLPELHTAEPDRPGRHDPRSPAFFFKKLALPWRQPAIRSRQAGGARTDLPLLFAELASKAGLPDGVLNVVGKGRIVGPRSCRAPHCKIDPTGGLTPAHRGRHGAERLVNGNGTRRQGLVVIFEDTPLEEVVAASVRICRVRL